MPSPFLTVTAAAKLTGKGRRAILRLVTRLAKEQPDQVMREKTPRGYIWKISQEGVEQAYGVAGTPADGVSPISQLQASAPPIQNSQSEKYMELVGQGYAGIMAMHQEVKQVYEDRLQEKDRQIGELKQTLLHVRKGFWARVLGG